MIAERRNGGSLDPERLLQWERCRPRLEVYLGSFAGLGREGIDEALQRTLIALWKKGGGLEGEARPWLYRVARNAALDLLRAKRREEGRRLEPRDGPRLEPSLGPRGEERSPVAELPSPYPGPEEGALGAEEETFVASFLASLPDGDRELLALAFAEGMSYPEIAALLGKPLGTVKWKVSELKRRLARRHEKEFGA